VKRVETDDPSVTDEMRAAVVQALAQAMERRAALQPSTARAKSVADVIEHHALALLAVARELRGQNGQVPATASKDIPPTARKER
jgi:hypothetical protein